MFSALIMLNISCIISLSGQYVKDMDRGRERMDLIRERLFFENGNTFPWYILGMYMPTSGPAYIHICTAIAGLQDDLSMETFLRGKPMLFELKKHSENSYWIKQIIKFHESVDEAKNETIADQVVSFLGGYYPMTRYIERKVTEQLQNGQISLPTEYFTRDGLEWLEQQTGYTSPTSLKSLLGW